jgi:hypothetical protein
MGLGEDFLDGFSKWIKLEVFLLLMGLGEDFLDGFLKWVKAEDSFFF